MAGAFHTKAHQSGKGAEDIQRMESDADKLGEEIRYHNRKYWVEHKPEISDPAYDRLVEQLKAIAPDHPALVELVEDAAQEFPKVKHDIPMLSIEKGFAVEEVVEWARKAGAFNGDAPEDGIAASYKIDGVSCSLVYEDGSLARAATRGNGLQGDDITRNAKVIGGIPHAIPKLKGARVEIRGEIYMSLASFKAALARFEKQLAAGEAREEEKPTNPRNYCAGSIKQKDPRITKERKLSFMAHGCTGKLPGADGKSEVSNQKTLEKLGFEAAFVSHVQKPEEVEKVIARIEAERKKLPYETDGVVFVINRLALHQELGYTSHHTRFRMAYKFSRDRGETTVRRIIWRTTRSGRAAPSMEVEPISLGGATVSLCTLHNAKLVKETKLVAGDRVLLEREVIPYFVQKMSETASEAKLPAKCDTCGATLVWDETETNLLCPNLGGCPSQLQDYLAYYVSLRVTNIVGVGEELVAKLFNAGLVKSPPDFFKLNEAALLENREKLEPMGEKKAANVIAGISAAREQTLETFLVSLGIKGLGPSVAARLAAHFGSLEAVLAAEHEALMGVEGIAETMADAIQNGLKERKHLIHELLQHVSLKTVEKVQGPLDGKSFCLTGHVEFDYDGKHYDARPDIEALIKSKGGAIKSVSKNLDYLVVGAEPGSKVEKARKAEVKIIDAKELLKMLT